MVLHGQHIGEAKEHAQHEFGHLKYINGYDDPEIIAGAGTMAIEILEKVLLLGFEDLMTYPGTRRRCGADSSRRRRVDRGNVAGLQDTASRCSGDRSRARECRLLRRCHVSRQTSAHI